MRRSLILLLLGAACGAPAAKPEDVASEPASPLPAVRAPPPGWEDPDPAGTPVEPLRAAFQAVPPGFAPHDTYTSHTAACVGVVRAEVPPRWRRAVLEWCEHRSFHASRNGKIVSKVDGTQIHDRDRPTAWLFWSRGMATEKLNPECPFHQINENIPHPPNCKDLQRNWPFRDVRLTEQIRNGWRKHPHDMERFGARGPHDWNANAYSVIPGCWDPEQLERFDVGITVTVRASLKICEKYGCATKWDIREHWGRRG